MLMMILYSKGSALLNSKLQAGSAKLNFLKTLQKHSAEHKLLAANFREGNNKFLRTLWKGDYMGSESRFTRGYTGIESEHSDLPGQQLDFDVTPPVRITRSRGLPLKCDNVQARTLEYKRRKKRTGDGCDND